MKRTLYVLFILYACSFFVNIAAAQELPLAVACMADDDKALEQEFCGLIHGAVVAHPDTRMADESDQSVVFVVVIPIEMPMCGEVLAVSVAATYGKPEKGMPKFYIFSACNVVSRDEFIGRAVAIVHRANLATRKWMEQRFQDYSKKTMRLETNP